MYSQNNELINQLKIWMLVLLGMIILIIIIGGLTRLTDSGLSITSWELFVGTIPPLSNEKWINYFNLYKAIPEFKEQNFNMSLSEFKIIFWWEWAHRQLGRLIGLIVMLPMIYFTIKNGAWILKKYGIIFILVCFQGLIGWYMVSSGLIENNDVSHFRLSVHLSLALLILSLIFWFILDIFKVKRFHEKISNLLLLFILLLIVIQIILGAFLSGLDGGLIYNSWPDMNGSFFPNDVKFNDVINSQLLNNPSIIQFLHRSTAYLLLFFIIILNFIYFKKKCDFEYVLFFDFAILIQIFLGIVTLISGVEITYASLHQLGSILVLSSYILILYKNIN